MIIGKDSWKKGGLLFLGSASILTCIIATLSSGVGFLQGVAVAALASTGVMVYKIYKQLNKK